ncbi:autophagy-related protein 13b [Andrographis paniculata]|uniref:autophagy-related protein 13b n=1 Tax=Andrographis paniculata TaxID=175694 RepID=UPI0021E9340F|nr:autophagy-related protein 13b [Andrographis paniculata]
MAPHGAAHTEPAVMEQIIMEFFAKSLHIILDSRCPSVSSRNYSGEQVPSSPSPSSSSSSSPSFRPRDRYLNPTFREYSAALEAIDLWRQSSPEPMIVDIVLVQRQQTELGPLNFSPKKFLARNSSGKERGYYSSDNDEFGCDPKNEKVIERWVLQYESRKNAARAGSKRSSCMSPQTLYKKSIVLLRSLYATVRLLPAYNLFRDLISSARIRLYNLRHRISSFVEPFTHTEEAEMQRFVFTPIDTSCGRLCLSVMYCSSVIEVSSEPSTPMSPQIISEYVGSPMAEPLRRVPMCSYPFGRRHSWSYDLYMASPPSANPSPSPTHSEPHALLSKRRSSLLPRSGLPRPTHDEPLVVYVKNQRYDEHCPSSSMLSPSPSPSPPMNVPGNHKSNVLSRCESAPVSIPIPRFPSMPSLPDKQLPPSVKADQLAVHKQISPAVNKLSSVRHDGPVLDVKSAASSPAKVFSRTSSRLSLHDDYDGFDFSGPFFVDDDEIMDSASRLDHPLGPHKRSQDPMVGALVSLLNKAPPLRPDASVASPYLQSTSSNISTSGLATSKTTADALEELQTYKDMKDALLKQGKDRQS